MNQTTSTRVRAGFQIVEILLSFIGALVAGTTYIAAKAHIDLPCTSDGGCEQVANSVYSHFSLFGVTIHVSLFGLLGYVVLLSLVMLRMASENPVNARRLHLAQTAISGFGFVYSWYLQYVAHFIIGAFCIWCRVSACTMTILFIVTTLDLLTDKSAGRQLATEANVSIE